MSDLGYKKVGHKKRRGRKKRPQGHKQHRKKGAIGQDSAQQRAFKRAYLQRRRDADERAEANAW